MKFRNGRNKPKAIKWFTDFMAQLAPHSDHLVKMGQAFEPLEHYFSVTIIHHLPNLYTKAGTINQKSTDCSNIEKTTIDAIFGKKYNEYMPNINIDDSQICELHSFKKFTEAEPLIEIHVSLKNRETL